MRVNLCGDDQSGDVVIYQSITDNKTNDSAISPHAGGSPFASR
jgi:hypothetical protein